MNEDKIKKLIKLYNEVNNLLCHITAEGEVYCNHQFVIDLAIALHEIDNGVCDDLYFESWIKENKK